MIDWKPLNPLSAPDEIEENMFLIIASDRVVSATHDAMNRWFYFEGEGYEIIYPYRLVTHYAEFNWPNVEKNNAY